MPKPKKPAPGSITWTDLTVKDAVNLCDFYCAVTRWKAAEVDMDGYSDFGMNTVAGRTVAGICHARGGNKNLPPQWLIYINVANLKRSLAACRRRGGKVVCSPREMSAGRMAVIRDPAGAVAALFEPN